MKPAALVSVALVALVIAVFYQTSGFDFVNYDDPGYVSAQPELRHGLSAEGLRWAVTLSNGGYMPLTGLSFLADAATHGMDPGGFHRTNVALHAAVAILLFLFLFRTTHALWPSTLAAALFAVHPLRVESVAWISARKDLTCGLFWMLTLHAYAYYVHRPSAWRYALVLAGVCAALLSKPMAVTLPAVLVLMDVWPLGRASWGDRRAILRSLAEKAPLFAASIVMSAATFVIQRHEGAVSSVDALPLTLRLENTTVSYASYLWKTAWPVDLAPLYPFPVNGIPAAAIAAAGAVLISITLAAAFASRRAPWAFSGWLWYLGTFVPMIGLIQVGEQSMADRYTYLPLIGLFIAIAWELREAALRWQRAGPALAAVATLAVAASAVTAHRQTSYWRDSFTLWSHAAAVTPRSATARNSLGEAYLQRGKVEVARGEVEEALRLDPDHRPALLNLALIEIRQGRPEEAIALCQRLVQRSPGDADAHTNWASALIREQRYGPALAHLDKALKSNPNHAEALANRGAALLYLGRFSEALTPLERAAERAPDDAVVLTNLAAAHLALGHALEARQFCDAALRRDPAYEQAVALKRRLDMGAR